MTVTNGLIGGSKSVGTLTDGNLGGGGAVSISTITNGSGNEVQRLSIAQYGTIDGGGIRLSFTGSVPPTQFVTWSSNQSVLKTEIAAALDALVGQGNATVFGFAADDFDVAFGGSLAGIDLAPLTFLNFLATNGHSSSQSLLFTATPTGGSFALTIETPNGTVTTGPITM